MTTYSELKDSLLNYLRSIEWRYRSVETTASVLTILGMAIGSTTVIGNGFYLASQVFWWWLTFSRKMWGLVLLNIAMSGVELWHLWTFFHGS